MVFSRRERLIIIVAAAALGLLALDVYVLTPMLDARADDQARKDRLVAKMEQANSILQRRRLVGRKWRGMVADGMRSDPAAAESQVLHALRDYSAETGLKLSSLRPERSVEKTKLPEILVHATAVGSMAAVSRFLWRLERAKIPLRVRMLQIASRKEGADDLSLQLRVSTLYAPSGHEAVETAGARPRRAGGDR